MAPCLTQGPSSFPSTARNGQTSSTRRGKRKYPHESDTDSERDNSKDNSYIDPNWDEDCNSNDEDDHDDTHSDKQVETFHPPIREGTLLITLLNQPPYTHWNIPRLARYPPDTPLPSSPSTQGHGKPDYKKIKKRTPLVQPKFRLLRSFEFRPEIYKGYEHRRTIGFKQGVSKTGNEEIVGRLGKARTWEFALDDKED